VCGQKVVVDAGQSKCVAIKYTLLGYVHLVEASVVFKYELEFGKLAVGFSVVYYCELVCRSAYVNRFLRGILFRAVRACLR